MNRQQAKELLPIIQAFAEGKIIRFYTMESGWVDIPKGENLDFCNDPSKYRIKTESRYRPFKNAEECWTEMLKHQPFGWVKDRGGLFLITYVEDNLIGYGSACGTILHCKLSDTLKGFTFIDGTPFGIKEG